MICCASLQERRRTRRFTPQCVARTVQARLDDRSQQDLAVLATKAIVTPKPFGWRSTRPRSSGRARARSAWKRRPRQPIQPTAQRRFASAKRWTRSRQPGTTPSSGWSAARSSACASLARCVAHCSEASGMPWSSKPTSCSRSRRCRCRRRPQRRHPDRFGRRSDSRDHRRACSSSRAVSPDQLGESVGRLSASELRGLDEARALVLGL